MDQRGRKSAESKALEGQTRLVEKQRPEPLEELTPDQAAEWRKVVNRLPVEWFPQESWPLLAQFCRHVVSARKVAELIEDVEAGGNIDAAEYDKLLKMQEREGRAITSLSTKMRISQQATIDPEKRKKQRAAKKPWES